jgi:hypothetical protein
MLIFILKKKTRKSLYIQDLSKAYDRVNISKLRLALVRLKIPYNIINLLIDSFKDRINQVVIHLRLMKLFKASGYLL